MAPPSVLSLASVLPAHLSTMQQLIDLSNEDFITAYAEILARGVAGRSRPRTEKA